MKQSKRHLHILGTRGIPAEHGGFETFAQECALYLRDHGWQVTVYCQTTGSGAIYEDEWQSIRRIIIPVNRTGPVSTILFDWRAIKHACDEAQLVLCLGYNTAVFNVRLRFRRIPVIINMDGIEWKRDKWNRLAKIWFYYNEKAGLRFSDHLIADNPGIEEHLRKRGVHAPLTTIPYGAPFLRDISKKPLQNFNLHRDGYILLIARPEPENSILEIITAFSSQTRQVQLVVLGNYSADHPYQKRVMDVASKQVLFCGAIYDQEIVSALRYHCLFYVHGHTVGGTNPSLVEALGAGNAVLAHDNIFNRWVTGEQAALFFSSEKECCQQLEEMLSTPALISGMKEAARHQFMANFTWENVLQQYESCFNRHLYENNHT